MSQKKTKKTKLKCICGHEQEVDTEVYKYNWKCDECLTINQIGLGLGVVWKCDTGTVRRGK